MVRVRIEESSSDEDESDGIRIDMILATETHTPAEWDIIVSAMRDTRYIQNGTVFDDIKPKNPGKSKTKCDPRILHAAIRGSHEATGDSGTQGEKRYLIKWKKLSHLHLSWEIAEDLENYVEGKWKLRSFTTKYQNGEINTSDGEYYDPSFKEIERIVHKNYDDDDIPEYLVKWKSLGYECCTWEREEDINDDRALEQYEKFSIPPSVRLLSSKRCSAASRQSKADFRAYSDKNVPVKNGDLRLRDYQLTGLNWMVFNWYNDRNSILADEMGLGKTVQTVSFVNHLVVKEQLLGPYLVVAPLSTLAHWQREFMAWTELGVVVYHGSASARKKIRQYEFTTEVHEDGSKIRREYKFQVCITTPELFSASNDAADELKRIRWELIVVDEAHRLKNPASKLYHSMKQLKTKSMLLLTGTPIQNNLDELGAIMHFLDPKSFTSVTSFVESYGDVSENVDALHTVLRPYILRRMKEDVEKSIAAKEEVIIEVELTVLQKQYYRAVYERNVDFLRGGKNSKVIPKLMNILSEIRKCCNHPYLIEGAEDREILRLSREAKVDRISEEQINQAMIQASGKLILLDKLLPRLQSDGHRVLIFSQFKIVLDIIQDFLHYKKYTFERIDGCITGNERQAAIDRYCAPDSDIFVMLLTTRAGGVGINLTSADTCIIYDSDWNPQSDLQAQARCHRIGQDKSVKIYRLLCSKTYEMTMFHTASMKLGLDKAVLGGMNTNSKDGSASLSKPEIESLLKHGAYEIFREEKEGTSASKSQEFGEASIDQILQRSKRVVEDGKSSSSGPSSFSKASFVTATGQENDVDVNDPDFWTKVIGLPTLPEGNEKKIGSTPNKKRKRRAAQSYKEFDASDFEELLLSDYKDSGSSTTDTEIIPSQGRKNPVLKAKVDRLYSAVISAIKTHGIRNWGNTGIDSFSPDQILVARQLRFAYLARVIHLTVISRRRAKQLKSIAIEKIAFGPVASGAGDSTATTIQSEASKARGKTAAPGVHESIETVTRDDMASLMSRYPIVAVGLNEALRLFNIAEHDFMLHKIPIPQWLKSRLGMTMKVEDKLRHLNLMYFVDYHVAHYGGKEKLLNRVLSGNDSEIEALVHSLHNGPQSPWVTGYDDLKLVLAVHKHGWNYNSALRLMNEIFADSSYLWNWNPFTTPVMLHSHLRFILAALINQNSKATTPPVIIAPKKPQVPSVIRAPVARSESKPAASVSIIWTQEAQDVLFSCILAYGLPESVPHMTPYQVEQLWLPFFNLVERFPSIEHGNVVSGLQGLVNTMTLRLQGSTPPTLWHFTDFQWSILSSRIKLFRKLRQRVFTSSSNILEMSIRTAVLKHPPQSALPQGWSSPLHDACLLQSVALFGLIRPQIILQDQVFSTLSRNEIELEWIEKRVTWLLRYMTDVTSPHFVVGGRGKNSRGRIPIPEEPREFVNAIVNRPPSYLSPSSNANRRSSCLIPRK